MTRLTKKVEKNRYIIECPNSDNYIDRRNPSRHLRKILYTQNKGIQKLGKLEDIEEKLDIDLIILFKALIQGFIYVDVKENNNGISQIEKFGVGGILFDKDCKVWRLTNDDRYDGAYRGSIATNKNYSKTWALTRKALSNGKGK